MNDSSGNILRLNATTALTSEAEITLGVLTAVQKNSAVTQRSMANELGIALGLANAYLRRCVRKGYIKLSQAPANRYAYYLTPKGFSEKSRLTARYLNQSLVLFRLARSQCVGLLTICTVRGWSRIAFHGAGDLYEIALLCARSCGIVPLGVADFRPAPADSTAPASSVPFVDDVRALGELDAVIVTDLQDPQLTYDTLVRIFPSERILVLPLLNIATVGSSARSRGKS